MDQKKGEIRYWYRRKETLMYKSGLYVRIRFINPYLFFSLRLFRYHKPLRNNIKCWILEPIYINVHVDICDPIDGVKRIMVGSGVVVVVDP